MRILLGMSGGLDSTWSARRLLDAGHSVEGAVLVMHGDTELTSAREAAAALGIALHEIDCRARFCETVIRDFASEYRRGRTPNPCIVCNREVKFRELLCAADQGGFDAIATGHYARIGERDGRYFIRRGADASRDQSYVLWGLGQDVLSRLVLPLGDAYKSDVRDEARRASVASADRPESREICFIPDHDYAAYIERHFGASPPGHFVDTQGRVLGEHRGILHYTVGQRRGLGIALGERMYVSEIRPDDNTVVLKPAEERSVTEFRILSPIFSGALPLADGERLHAEVSVRYQAKPIGATLAREGEEWRVTLDEPIRSVTAGQSAVFYEGDALLLGGFIA